MSIDMIAPVLACTACRFHHQSLTADGKRAGPHLCTVRHALPDPEGMDPERQEAFDRNFVGWICDFARKQFQVCGPYGKLWAARDPAEPPK